MEHNAVVRPLARLTESIGTRVERILCDGRGRLELEDLRKALATPARLVILNHASNVTGALQPAREVARLCSEAGIPLLLDAAQTAGLQPIAAEDWNLGMLACSGHKGLLGPPGVGLLYLRPDLDVLPLLEGGTGSRSEEERQPSASPDRYESGTLNLPGIAGLSAGLDFIAERGVEEIRAHETALASSLERELSEIPGVKVQTPEVRGSGAVSFTVEGMAPSDVGFLLDEGFDIAVRTGLHCAPLAHHTLGTFPEGTIRASVGFFTTRDETDRLGFALREIARNRCPATAGTK
jgi:selenocysteine lyase/cysteine desulfurase